MDAHKRERRPLLTGQLAGTLCVSEQRQNVLEEHDRQSATWDWNVSLTVSAVLSPSSAQMLTEGAPSSFGHEPKEQSLKQMLFRVFIISIFRKYTENLFGKVFFSLLWPCNYLMVKGDDIVPSSWTLEKPVLSETLFSPPPLQGLPELIRWLCDCYGHLLDYNTKRHCPQVICVALKIWTDWDIFFCL